MECGSSAAAFLIAPYPPSRSPNFSTIFHSHGIPVTPRQPLQPLRLPRSRSNQPPSFEQSLHLSIILLTTSRNPATIPHDFLARHLPVVNSVSSPWTLCPLR